jgi:exonuclease-1
MLSGCDYLPSIPGLGLKTSHKLLRRYKTVERILNAIRSGAVSNRLKLAPVVSSSGYTAEGCNGLEAMMAYLRDFRVAELAFLYQRAYDPFNRRLVHLTDVPESLRNSQNWDDKFVGQ